MKMKWGKMCSCIQYCVLYRCVSIISMMTIIVFLRWYLEFYISLAFKGSVGGEEVIFPPKDSTFDSVDNVIVENVVLTYLMNSFICSYFVVLLC